MTRPAHTRSPGGGPQQARTRGFSLIELMVVVAIISILASIAYPSYTQYVMRSNRQAARAMLLQVADRQEQYFLDNRSYAATLTDLGYANAVIAIDKDGQLSTTTTPKITYRVWVTNRTATTYTLSAAPEGIQSERDADCGALSLASSGLRTQSGSATNCW